MYVVGWRARTKRKEPTKAESSKTAKRVGWHKTSERLGELIDIFRGGFEMVQPVCNIAHLLELGTQAIEQREPLRVLICIGGEEAFDVAEVKFDLALRLIGLCGGGGCGSEANVLCVREWGEMFGKYVTMFLKKCYLETYGRDVLVCSRKKNVAEILGGFDDLLFTGRFYICQKGFGDLLC